jgi:hypothetical protein
LIEQLGSTEQFYTPAAFTVSLYPGRHDAQVGLVAFGAKVQFWQLGMQAEDGTHVLVAGLK